jgi:glycosyltransferase involved in cell wall biosynthesis
VGELAGKNLVIMPAFNEEASIDAVIREVIAECKTSDILVVNDGSADQTAAVAQRAGAKVLSLPFNLGVGGAMRAGFRYAVRNGYQSVVQVDADGQHDPRDVLQLIKALDHSDVVIGARFAGVGDYRVSGPRAWAMKSLAIVISRIAKTKLSDTTSGFRATGPRALLLFERNFPVEYLGDTVESLVIAAKTGLRISQVPVEMRVRSGGAPSQNPIKSGLYLARAWMALLFALLKPRTDLNGTL